MNSFKRIAVVDIETTGPHIEDEDGIIQIAAVFIEEGVIVDELSMYINPQREIPKIIVELTGIDDEMVAEAPTFPQVANLWHHKLKDCLLIAHNLNFDLRVLQTVFEQADLEYQPTAMDTVKLAKILAPDAMGFNLMDLSIYFNLDFEDAHNALADARLTAVFLSELAVRATTIDPSTVDQIRQLMKFSSHDEDLFFQAPQRFILKDRIDEEGQAEIPRMPIQEDAYTKSQVNYIVNQWDQHPYLVIEDQDKPISKELIQGLIAEVGKARPMILVVPTSQHITVLDRDFMEHSHLDYQILKSPNHYLHLGILERYLRDCKYRDLNQHDLVRLAAIQYWLSYTTTGDYQEIHAELHIQDLLDKFQRRQKSSSKHEYYQRAIERAKAADLVIVNHYYFIHHIQTSSIDRSSYALIFVDIPQAIQSYRRSDQEVLSLSNLFVTIRNIYNIFENSFHGHSQLTQALTTLESIMEDVESLQESLFELLDERNASNSQNQVRVESYLSRDYQTQIELFTRLNQIQQDLSRLSHQAQYLEGIEILSEFFDKCESHARAFERFLDKTSERLLYIQANRVDGRYYLLKLYSQPYRIQGEILAGIYDFDQVAFISAGEYRGGEIFGFEQLIDLERFRYQALPHSSQGLIEIQIPAEYMTHLDDHRRKKLLSEFILQQLINKHDQIMILLPNKESLYRTYQSLKSREELEDYAIMAYGITGNTHRLRRKLLEKSQNILLMTVSNYYQEQWYDKTSTGAIIIMNLPFESPDRVQIQALVEELDLGDNYQNFKRVQFPLMLRNLKLLSQSIEEHYPDFTYYLMDERMFASSYSDELTRQLEKMILFSILG